MTIILNGEARDIEATMLDRAMIELGFGDAVVATALNGEFVAQSNRGVTPVEHGDQLEVLAPMQGG
ncbi:MAG: sulfur carrier protein ThiS [Gammaproteobacteria bacterium]